MKKLWEVQYKNMHIWNAAQVWDLGTAEVHDL